MRRLLNIDFYTFYLVLFSLPFGRKVFIPILLFWILLVLISYFSNRDYSADRFKGLLILPIAFYLILTVREVVSSSLEIIISDLQLKLTLLLIPLLYPYHRKNYQNSNNAFLWSFVAGCATASVYYIGYAIFRSYTLLNGIWVFNPIPPYGWDNYFLSTTFSYLIHPSYLALYLLVAILFIGVKLKLWWEKTITTRILVILSIIAIITSLIMLQSRAGIIGFGLLALIWLFYIVFIKRNYKAGIGILLVFFSLSTIILTKIDRYSDTLKSLVKFTDSGVNNQTKLDGTIVRLWIWEASINVIKEHPVLGVGTSNTRQELQAQYEMLGMDKAAEVRLNAHNQYLESWISIGIIGFLALLAMLFVPLWAGIRNRNWLLAGFICLCSVSFFFESMLETIAGVTFFALFYTMLVTTNKPIAKA